MSVNEFYNPKGDYSETWHKPEEIIYPEPMDEDNGCVKDIMEQDLDDIDQNLEWLKPNKSSTQEIYFGTLPRCWKILKKSHSTLRAKRATFTF